jgi:hypothetical protein
MMGLAITAITAMESSTIKVTSNTIEGAAVDYFNTEDEETRNRVGRVGRVPKNPKNPSRTWRIRTRH